MDHRQREKVHIDTQSINKNNTQIIIIKDISYIFDYYINYTKRLTYWIMVFT